MVVPLSVTGNAGTRKTRRTAATGMPARTEGRRLLMRQVSMASATMSTKTKLTPEIPIHEKRLENGLSDCDIAALAQENPP
ncbi:MAG: hypothetical protein WDM88_08815 [Galbitalea sp.]